MDKREKWWLFRAVVMALNCRDNPDELKKALDRMVPFVKKHQDKHRMLKLKENDEGQESV